jgi:hypothetical protein
MTKEGEEGEGRSRQRVLCVQEEGEGLLELRRIPILVTYSNLKEVEGEEGAEENQTLFHTNQNQFPSLSSVSPDQFRCHTFFFNLGFQRGIQVLSFCAFRPLL